MIAFLREWREQRARCDEEMVRSAIRQLRPSHAAVYPIHRLARIRVTRVYAALERLHARGEVTAEWEVQPAWTAEFRPRRRLYRIAKPQPVEVGR